MLDCYVVRYEEWERNGLRCRHVDEIANGR